MDSCGFLGLRCTECGAYDAECLCGTELAVDQLEPLVSAVLAGDDDVEEPGATKRNGVRRVRR